MAIAAPLQPSLSQAPPLGPSCCCSFPHQPILGTRERTRGALDLGAHRNHTPDMGVLSLGEGSGERKWNSLGVEVGEKGRKSRCSKV